LYISLKILWQNIANFLVWQHTFSCRVAVITYNHIIWTYNYEDDKKQQHEATDILVRHYKQLTPDIQGTWFKG